MCLTTARHIHSHRNNSILWLSYCWLLGSGREACSTMLLMNTLPRKLSPRIESFTVIDCGLIMGHVVHASFVWVSLKNPRTNNQLIDSSSFFLPFDLLIFLSSQFPPCVCISVFHSNFVLVCIFSLSFLLTSFFCLSFFSVSLSFFLPNNLTY